ncbi:DUF72 domain-containing protein [Parapedobacter sp. DT-150]|uniref:DUF72 domain-containing protein n=1 Tax=Parapedobacter sp. DT-150 TaxID=3396162 RepID=UPI003F1A5533
MKTGTVHIGTSGWHYKHWKGIFYPDGLKDASQLQYYVQSFGTVEINNTFYRIPTEATFGKWAATASDGFLFAVKANRYITHLKKLHDVDTYADDFIQKASLLGPSLGPILFQLPPFWKVDTQRLADFVKALPKGPRYAFEFRNQSWYSDAVYEILHRHHCAFCIYELAGHLSPMEITAQFAYVRLHGPGGKYQGKYTDATLSEWAERCRQWQQRGKDVFIYFDNDQHAYAVDNAKELTELVT